MTDYRKLAEQIEESYELIWPEMATKWLNSSPYNRVMNDRVVSAICEHMNMGRWIMHFSMIALDEDGNLLNGHHSCVGIEKVGKPQWCRVLRNVPRELVSLLDTVNPRRAQDYLRMFSDSDAATLSESGVLNTLLDIAEGRWPQHHMAMNCTAQGLQGFCEDNLHILDHLPLAREAARVLNKCSGAAAGKPPSAMIGWLVACCLVDRELGQGLCARIIDMEASGKPNGLEWSLARALSGARNEGFKSDSVRVKRVFNVVWRAWSSGREITAIKYNTGAGDAFRWADRMLLVGHKRLTTARVGASRVREINLKNRKGRRDRKRGGDGEARRAAMRRG
jgi:hypothetical protein